MLVRTWNLFHGNTEPVGEEQRLEEMIRLVTADRPDVVCLQEVPVWGISRLSSWSGMHSAGAVAQPAPLGGRAGRRLTALAPKLVRGFFNGQANAVLLAPRLRVLQRHALVLNQLSFRQTRSGGLNLGLRARRDWAKERRVCQGLRVRLVDGRSLVLGNLHATSHPDPRVPAAELLRAATFVDALADPAESCVLAGDFNLTPAAPMLESLTSPEWGFSRPGPWLDHVLVRGASASPPHSWPLERRESGGRVLSDHAPVEVTIDDL